MSSQSPPAGAPGATAAEPTTKPIFSHFQKIHCRVRIRSSEAATVKRRLEPTFPGCPGRYGAGSAQRGLCGNPIRLQAPPNAAGSGGLPALPSLILHVLASKFCLCDAWPRKPRHTRCGGSPSNGRGRKAQPLCRTAGLLRIRAVVAHRPASPPGSESAQQNTGQAPAKLRRGKSPPSPACAT